MADAVITVTVFVAYFVGSTVEVAVTVSLSAISSGPTVRTPVSLIMVFSEECSEMLQITVWAGLFSPVTVAFRVSGKDGATLEVPVILTEVTVAGVVSVK